MSQMNEEENRPEDINRPMAVFYAYDDDDFETYSHAIGYKLAIYDLRQHLRADYKWKNLPDEVMKYIEEIRDYLGELQTLYHLPED